MPSLKRTTIQLALWLAALLAVGVPVARASIVPLPVGQTHAAAHADLDPGLAADLQAVLDGFRAQRPTVGVSAAVVLGDGARWAGGSGLRDQADLTSAMVGDSPSVVGSITKTFVAALVMQLVEEGRLSLKTRLSRWFPEYSFARTIRIRNLLQHTSGLPDYFTHPDYARLVYHRPDHHWTTQEILGLVRTKLLFPPGQGWSYSNTNYLFLGLVAERITGHSLAAELRARFFDPLALTQTYFQGDEPPPAGAAAGYLLKKGHFVGYGDGSDYRPNTSAATVAWAAGAIVSSAADIATWTDALYGGHVVTSKSLARMTTFNTSNYGFGTQLLDAGGVRAWGHTGSLRGYVAMTMYLPDRGADRDRVDQPRSNQARARGARACLGPHRLAGHSFGLSAHVTPDHPTTVGRHRRNRASLGRLATRPFNQGTPRYRAWPPAVCPRPPVSLSWFGGCSTQTTCSPVWMRSRHRRRCVTG